MEFELKGRLKGARVLVKEEKRIENTQGGIIIPGSEKEPTYKGIAIMVGDGALLETGVKIPVDVKPGETVYYIAFSGAPIVIGNDVYLVLNERDIIFVE